MLVPLGCRVLLLACYTVEMLAAENAEHCSFAGSLPETTAALWLPEQSAEAELLKTTHTFSVANKSWQRTL